MVTRIRVKRDTMRAFWVKNPARINFWTRMAAISRANTPPGELPLVRVLQVVA